MLLRRTVSPILFIVITGSDQVNVGTQVNKMLQVHRFNLLQSYSLAGCWLLCLIHQITIGTMDVMGIWGRVEIYVFSQSQVLDDEKNNLISQDNLTSFSLSTQIIKAKFHFQIMPFLVLFHNKICFLIKFFTHPSFTEDITQS